jgi:protein-S-isoprenylcysteine O-methyltransferase Ste14
MDYMVPFMAFALSITCGACFVVTLVLSIVAFCLRVPQWFRLTFCCIYFGLMSFLMWEMGTLGTDMIERNTASRN